MITDNYKTLKSQEKVDLFTELFKLKDEKSKIEKRIKELEVGYKAEIKLHAQDVFYQLPNGLKFSIKQSERKGALDVDKIERVTGIDCELYRKEPTTIMTLRKDK